MDKFSAHLHSGMASNVSPDATVLVMTVQI